MCNVQWWTKGVDATAIQARVRDVARQRDQLTAKCRPVDQYLEADRPAELAKVATAMDNLSRRKEEAQQVGGGRGSRSMCCTLLLVQVLVNGRPWLCPWLCIQHLQGDMCCTRCKLVVLAGAAAGAAACHGSGCI